MAYYAVYGTADGRFISLGCNEPAFFRELCAELGLEELIERQQVEDPAWQEHAREAIQAKIATGTLAEWEARFGPKDIAFAPVRSIDEILHDSHYIERGLVHPGEDGSARSARIGSPFHLSDTPVAPSFTVPLPGEHTGMLLAAIGIDAANVAELISSGVVA